MLFNISLAQIKGKLKSNKFSEKAQSFSGLFDFTYKRDKDLINRLGALRRYL